MAASRETIKSWLREMTDKGASHMIVAYDSWDHEDYPIFVMPTASGGNGALLKRIAESTDRVMEVYTASLPDEQQLDEPRAWHLYD